MEAVHRQRQLWADDKAKRILSRLRCGLPVAIRPPGGGPERHAGKRRVQASKTTAYKLLSKCEHNSGHPERGKTAIQDKQADDEGTCRPVLAESTASAQ